MRIALMTAVLMLIGCSSDSMKIVDNLSPFKKCEDGKNLHCDVGTFTSFFAQPQSCERIVLTDATAQIYLTAERNNETCPPCPSIQEREVMCAIPTGERRIVVWTPEGKERPTGHGTMPASVETREKDLVEGACPLTCD